MPIPPKDKKPSTKHRDKELTTAAHDELLLWLNENVDDAVDYLFSVPVGRIPDIERRERKKRGRELDKLHKKLSRWKREAPPESALAKLCGNKLEELDAYRGRLLNTEIGRAHV